jgi:phosphoribosylglycinamide formyltransferase 2
MSSSGKDNHKTEADIEKAWNYIVEGSRGDVVEVIGKHLLSSIQRLPY